MKYKLVSFHAGEVGRFLTGDSVERAMAMPTLELMLLPRGSRVIRVLVPRKRDVD
jgi:hypothetical protein